MKEYVRLVKAEARVLESDTRIKFNNVISVGIMGQYMVVEEGRIAFLSKDEFNQVYDPVEEVVQKEGDITEVKAASDLIEVTDPPDDTKIGGSI